MSRFLIQKIKENHRFYGGGIVRLHFFAAKLAEDAKTGTKKADAVRQP